MMAHRGREEGAVRTNGEVGSVSARVPIKGLLKCHLRP